MNCFKKNCEMAILVMPGWSAVMSGNCGTNGTSDYAERLLPASMDDQARRVPQPSQRFCVALREEQSASRGT